MAKISTGVTDALKTEKIAKSRPGLPDDSSQTDKATEEPLGFQRKLEDTANKEQKDEAYEFAKQFARPKDGTA